MKQTNEIIIAHGSIKKEKLETSVTLSLGLSNMLLEVFLQPKNQTFACNLVTQNQFVKSAESGSKESISSPVTPLAAG